MAAADMVKVDSWNQDLSPWQVPPVFGDEDFGDGAANTLSFILSDLIPQINFIELELGL